MKYFIAGEMFGPLKSLHPWRWWGACKMNKGQKGVKLGHRPYRGRWYGVVVPF